MTDPMSDVDLFFELDYQKEEIPERVERDQWGRPLILQPDGSKVAYTRASTLAGYLENKKGLHTWDMRRVALGVGLDEDLAAMAASVQPLTGDKRKDANSNETLDEVIERARDRAGEHAGRDWGTAVHGFTEPGQEGNPYVPKRMQDDVNSYWSMMNRANIRCVASEVFVVCDQLRVAGSFDDLYYSYAFGLTLGDKKTGKARIHSHLIQLAVYANSEVYDIDTGERRPLQSLVADPALAKYPINPKVAFWVHIAKGEGTTRFVGLNLERGWEAAQIAAAARDYQSQREGLVFDADVDLVRGGDTERAWELIAGASSLDELTTIAIQYQHVWTDQMTRAGQRLIASWSESVA
jgi:hypothetical protein